MGIWDSPVKEAEIIDSSNGPVKVEVVTDQPVVKVEAKAEATVTPLKPEFKGLPVRSGGDRIWLLKGGHKCWIRNAEIFSKLGFKFGDEREIDFDTLQLIPEGTPISE